MNLVILVQSSNDSRYRPCADTVLDTWASSSPAGVTTLLYFGRRDDMEAPPSESAYRKDNLLICDSDDIHHRRDGKFVEVRTMKFVRALQWVLKNTEADFVYRCNCTCYVDQKRLHKYVSSLPTSKVYDGPICLSKDDIYLVSGCDMLLSRDVAQYLVDNHSMLDPDLIDDVAIGKLLTSDLIPFEQIRNRTMEIYSDTDKNRMTHKPQFFHYKFNTLTMDKLIYFHSQALDSTASKTD